MSNKNIVAAMVGMLLALNSASLFANSSTDNVDDSVITAQVKAKIMADKEVSGLKVKIDTNNGVVSISGVAKTDHEASTLVEMVQSTEGVKNVDTSKLHVKKSNQPFSDTLITAKVKGAFAREKVFGDAPISVTGIEVETKNGVVFLNGNATAEQASNAVKIAEGIDNVKRVESKIKQQ